MINIIEFLVQLKGEKLYLNFTFLKSQKSRITLMGQSSGAALAHDVALTPQMKGKLFNVIPLSGAAVSYWGYWNSTQSLRNARELASGAHCNFPDTKAILLLN